MHGVQNGGLRPRRRRRRQLNSRGERRAVRQALTGAKLYLAGEFPSLKAAAEAVGVSVRYVHAGVILLQAENADLLAQVLAGEMLTLAAAKEAKPVAKAIAAYKAMTEADKKASSTGGAFSVSRNTMLSIRDLIDDILERHLGRTAAEIAQRIEEEIEARALDHAQRLLEHERKDQHDY